MGPVKLPRKALVAALVLSLVAAVFMTTVAPAISSAVLGVDSVLSLIHISEPTRPY